MVSPPSAALDRPNGDDVIVAPIVRSAGDGFEPVAELGGLDGFFICVVSRLVIPGLIEWRFSSSDKVGGYLGLAPRRYALGETDRAGRISKCGDGLVRTYLVETAGVLLTRSKATSDLKDWGLRLAKRASAAKARVGVARKLSVILRRLWSDNSVFQPRANVITG
jgi:hypothetical protein